MVQIDKNIVTDLISIVKNLEELKDWGKDSKYFFKLVDDNLEVIKKPRFFFKHLNELCYGLTYRQINYWDTIGLLDFKRQSSKKGWRKFSFIDIINILVLQYLIYFGVSSERIKDTIEYMNSNQGYKFGDITPLELFIFYSLAGKHYNLVLHEVGWSLILPSNNYYEIITPYDITRSGQLLAPFSMHIDEVIKKLGYEIKFEKVRKLREMIPFHRVMYIIDSGEYKEVKIKLKDGKIKRLGLVKSQQGNFSDSDAIRLINKNDFQKVEVMKKDGNIVTITNEESLKF